ncbi:cyclic nucleotide-binding domain-containing protein [Marinobacter sp. CHS3-4]|uniref:cyclic nucleotide-binding domain-containing protein n=1 Tax=Marinobacter sp. CHS3-4 TaxID=3045174 RepID=UPI0024B575F3|nr:cyclic nucleotide-binding domain-containing protein [Marinobacter sp. CHS3-4]MDI9245945.1 4Fe-4S dicluster domain-containing protein [Marinobacter sp. CHS3-4]
MTEDNTPTQIKRPKKWDHAFSAEMAPDQVASLLEREPFVSMVPPSGDSGTDAKAEKVRGKIQDILLNESRLLNFEKDEVIVRQGDYGATAYFIVSGNVSVLFNVDKSALGRGQAPQKSLWAHVKRVLSNPSTPEARDPEQYDPAGATEERLQQGVFLQDVPRVIAAQKYDPDEMGPGEIFGEIGALSRSIRSATIIATCKTQLLEIKWQGLRDLLQVSKPFRESVDRVYRERSLRSHLLSLDLFQKLPESALQALVDGAEFVSVGKRDWNTNAGDTTPIVNEGDYASALLILRSGFAKKTKAYGHSEYTISYLSKGDVFGLDEMLGAYQGANTGNSYQNGIAALGYTDMISLPGSLCDKHLFPHLEAEALGVHINKPTSGDPLEDTKKNQLMDFFVDERFINGTETMLINLDRCTGCDDCVRACATNHDNNPRFIRHGKQFENIMVANACMHCADPVCMIGCPTGAIHRSENGEVVINDTTCIGCQTCANSCPYDNIRMVEIRDQKGHYILDEQMRPINKATKCDLCYDNPVSPACQNACPHDALRRVNLADEEAIKDWLK